MTRREYVVGRGDAMRVADAVQRYQAGRWQFWAPILVTLLIVAVVGYTSGGAGEALAGVVLILVAAVGVVLYQRRRLATVLAARGFRPGARIATDFDGDRFTVTVEMGTSSHTSEDVADVRVVRGIVLFRNRLARYVLALPVQLVPDETLRALMHRS